MSDMQDYNSSLSDAAQSRRFETFSYLPPLSKESTRAQIQYIVDKGWNPGIEHTEPENLPRRSSLRQTGSSRIKRPLPVTMRTGAFFMNQEFTVFE